MTTLPAQFDHAPERALASWAALSLLAAASVQAQDVASGATLDDDAPRLG